MAHTNRGRVILGGLLAGAVINIVEFITNGLVLNDAWANVMQSPRQTAAAGKLHPIVQCLGLSAGHW